MGGRIYQVAFAGVLVTLPGKLGYLPYLEIKLTSTMDKRILLNGEVIL